VEGNRDWSAKDIWSLDDASFSLGLSTAYEDRINTRKRVHLRGSGEGGRLARVYIIDTISHYLGRAWPYMLVGVCNN
jgi:hypothetical protein